jgi:type I restriction enzyme R subunit
VGEFIDPEEVLASFKTYYATAELEGITDPHLVYDLRAKLDGAGFYDDFEVERVVAVTLDAKAKQGDLVVALEPVVDRLLKRYKAGQVAVQAARDKGDAAAEQEARNELDSLVLFKGDMGAYLRLYAFLSQIFDYGNTAIEKRAIFFKCLLPLLEFGRERDGVDLSKVVMTHHKLKDQGKRALPLQNGEYPKLSPLTDAGGGAVHEKEKSRLYEIIAKLNDLFEGDVTEDDKLVYVNNVLKGKLLESEILVRQAASNTKEQLKNSPDLLNAIVDAILGASAAHSAMSKQALNSEKVRYGLRDVLMGPAQLYEALRERSE